MGAVAQHLAQQPLFAVYGWKATASFRHALSRENAFVALRRARQTRNKNNLSSEHAQSNAERIQNRLPQNRYKENPWNL
jgi:hypothetical protein